MLRSVFGIIKSKRRANYARHTLSFPMLTECPSRRSTAGLFRWCFKYDDNATAASAAARERR